MIKNIFYRTSLIIVVLAGCETKEKAELQSKVDSLQFALESSQKMTNTMMEVSALMDSIDASRQMLKVNMVEGTTYDDYTARMKDINSYVKDTQAKLNKLESDLKKSNIKSSSYAGTVKKLQRQLEEKAEEIILLNEQIEKFRSENINLSETVTLQEAMLQDKEAQILAKQQELALIEARIQELMIQSKMSEADAYYARAMAVEEAAMRTKLAPRKKKETLREALELYKKSLSLGKEEAQEKITDLEKRI